MLLFVARKPPMWLTDGFWSLFWQLEGTVCIHINSRTAEINLWNVQVGWGTKLNTKKLGKFQKL